MITHYENGSATGEWLRLMAEIEHEPSIPMESVCRDGQIYWRVGGEHGVLIADRAEAEALAKVA